jgi:SRSO17 transposase
MQLGTTVPLPRDIDADLDRWLEPFLDATGRSTRRKMAPLYVRGLLGSGGRKSIQPMAERLGLSSHEQLHHFISSPAWDDAPLWRVLAEQVNREVGGEGAVLVVDDVGVPKKGELSVGVARQDCGALGKVANSQVLVTLTLARGEVPLPVGMRLFLPSAWTDDPQRCEEAGVPEAARTAQTKPAIALAEIDRVREAGLRFSCVLADAGFGSSPAFRHGLDERELAWAAGIACTQLSRLPEVLRHARTEPMVSGWTHPDRAIRRSVGRSVEACCERLNRRTTPDFIGAFGRLPRSQKVSLLPSLPSMRVWNAARSIVGLSAILPNERPLRWLMANDPVVRA